MRQRVSLLTAIAWLILFAYVAFPQSSPVFDAASVKPAAPQADGRIMTTIRGGPGSPDPGQITYTNVTLSSVITRAYDVKDYQVTGTSQLTPDRFDIVAKVPAGATKEQFGLMLQNLLAERFHLKLHRETKEMQGFELVVGKNGSKLKESSPEDAAIDQSAEPKGPPAGPPKPDANGFIKLDHPGAIMMMRMSEKGAIAAHMTGRAQTISQLLNLIGSQLNRPVVDKTGLTGKYDFTLEYAPENMGTMMVGGTPPPGAGATGPPAGGLPEDAEPNLVTALPEQLGLRLEPKKVQVDILVIDHADKTPTDN